MNIIILCRQAITLARSAFTSFTPYIVLGILASALSMNAFLPDIISNGGEPIIEEILSFKTFMIMMLMLVVAFFLQMSAMLVAHGKHHQSNVTHSKAIMQSIIKFLPLIALIIRLLLWPLLIGAVLIFLSSIALFIFGSSVDFDIASLSSVTTGADFQIATLLFPVIILAGLAYVAYIYILYFFIAVFGLFAKNLTVSESIKRSKELVKGYKLYVALIFIASYIVAKLFSHFMLGNGMFSNIILASFSWAILMPFQVCMMVVVYDYLEKAKLSAPNVG